MSVRTDLVRTSGTATLDGRTFEGEDNVWILGDHREVLVIDPSHASAPIVEAIGSRMVAAIVCTHANNDHINAAVPLADEFGAPILLHADDRELWNQVNPHREPDWALSDGELLTVAGTDLEVLHTPGKTRGSICLHVPGQSWLFSGDTLFQGGPGTIGRSYSDFGSILRSITNRLFTLDESTVVHTGHGPMTTIGSEHARAAEWFGVESLSAHS